MSEPYHNPTVRINRVTTKGGDRGETSLVGGQRLSKTHPRVEAYGTVDELNAHLGVSLEIWRRDGPDREDKDLSAMLERVQHELFNLGSLLATPPGQIREGQPRITEAEVVQLEADIESCNADLEPLTSFVLPGGCEVNAWLHVCRTVTRRAERQVVALAREEEVPIECVQYLNRLSDAFFVWSRYASRCLKLEERVWQPNWAASGRRTEA